MQSVDRAVLLLRAVARAESLGISTAAVGEECGLNRATAWRLLSTLQIHALVTSEGPDRRWRLGAGVLELVRVAGLDEVLHDVQGVLRRVALQTGETAALAVLRNGSLTYIDEAEPAAVVAVSWIGQSMSLHATSTGKVLLAWSTPDDADHLLPRRLQRFTHTTIVDHAVLREDLEATRRRGYATCSGEYDESAWGVSAPVLDPTGHLLAVLSIWGPPPRVNEVRFEPLAEVIIEAAAQIAPQPAASR